MTKQGRTRYLTPVAAVLVLVGIFTNSNVLIGLGIGLALIRLIATFRK